MFDFEKLTVYKKAKLFYIECIDISDALNLEGYIKNQLRRVAFSVPLTIAEGSGKFSKAYRKNHFYNGTSVSFE